MVKNNLARSGRKLLVKRKGWNTAYKRVETTRGSNYRAIERASNATHFIIYTYNLHRSLISIVAYISHIRSRISVQVNRLLLSNGESKASQFKYKLYSPKFTGDTHFIRFGIQM